MAAITSAQALSIVSLAGMKEELRIPATETEHDALLTAQIVSAASYAATSTGAELTAELRPAIVAAVRVQYDGDDEITKDAAHDTWMEPFRSYAAE